MNQDSFRKLLTTPRPGSSSTSSRVEGQSTKKATLDVSEPAFQPRKVKKRKIDSAYRDRASERRAGINDYADVESVLEDFEKKTAAVEDRDAVEEQRRYLGGDKDHTILVKGLDFALLEQNKARSMLSLDDDSLEAAFQEAQPKYPVLKKRTRDDLIQELKEKRTSRDAVAVPEEPSTDRAFEEARKVGKFKPIGTPDQPTGHKDNTATKGKDRDKARAGHKKKRRKAEQGSSASIDKHDTKVSRSQMTMPKDSELPSLSSPQASTATSAAVSNARAQVLEPVLRMENPDDVDIFADVGEYKGVDFGEDEDEERPVGSAQVEEYTTVVPKSDTVVSKGWFTEDETASIPGPSVVQPTDPPTPGYVPEEPEEPEPQQVTRLAPLASSALPSISDFLAMDAQAGAQKKKKERKEKKKGGEKKEKLSTEVKADRDYKKLSSYLAKKDQRSEGV